MGMKLLSRLICYPLLAFYSLILPSVYIVLPNNWNLESDTTSFPNISQSRHPIGSHILYATPSPRPPPLSTPTSPPSSTFPHPILFTIPAFMLLLLLDLFLLEIHKKEHLIVSKVL
uniref:Uncharacterized protein n=1 Tax=Cacopsylla melanoneura TaxID=428564 RepID=A0A8D8QV88_9HEMI